MSLAVWQRRTGMLPCGLPATLTVARCVAPPAWHATQVGGSDQWGNITAGTDLIRKLMGGDSGEEAPQCFGLTFPLLVSARACGWLRGCGGSPTAAHTCHM
jgi:hypothetical protein